MAFNSSTFDLTGRWPLVEIWVKANRALEDDPTKTFYVPAESLPKAKTLMHTFNRVRRALKAQKEGSDSLDHIILRVVEEDISEGGVAVKQYTISFSDRSEPLQSLKILDKQGNIL